MDQLSRFDRMLREGRSFSGRERNCFFLNTLGSEESQGRMANISATSGFDFPDDGRAVAVVDWDQDGHLDLWVSNRNAPRLRLVLNTGTSGNHFLALRLVGDGKRSNRDAVGARVTVVTEDPHAGPLVRTVRAGEGFMAQSSRWLHFGLGDDQRIAKVTVRWPDGTEQELGGLSIDTRYELRQGSDLAMPVPSVREPLALRGAPMNLPPQTGKIRIPLAVRLPMPRTSYVDLAGNTQQLPLGRGRPVLLNLWSKTCAPCITELGEFAAREKSLRESGIEVVALAVDVPPGNTEKGRTAQKILERLKFPFAAGDSGRSEARGDPPPAGGCVGRRRKHFAST